MNHKMEAENLRTKLYKTFTPQAERLGVDSKFLGYVVGVVGVLVAEAKLDEAADIHYEGIKLLASNHRATLNQLLDIIEHRHGKDMIAVSGKYNRVEGK